MKGAPPLTGFVETVKDWPTSSFSVDQVPPTLISEDVWRDEDVAFVTSALIGVEA